MERNGLPSIFIAVASVLSFLAPASSFDYKDALSKSLIYFEAQRSGHLPYDQRVRWRGHSRLTDGLQQGVDYILSDNPLQMSYMVGYGDKFPQRIHHRASSLPSMDVHPEKIPCKGGTPFYLSSQPNPNLLVGASVGGPVEDDRYLDLRSMFTQSEPTTYINAPMVGLLAYFHANA
ncbi:uncharacterized protein A4U43_C07F160 [Asparagus officinalis]|uniref:Endoglucanase n=1 Tax=Asparagus officinalis TaxID=4686 RepID=A0A5P1EBH7_ASPOF|nr:uncharacterized protein A4U43_C07F160 [Asparagus officinalis]